VSKYTQAVAELETNNWAGQGKPQICFLTIGCIVISTGVLYWCTKKNERKINIKIERVETKHGVSEYNTTCDLKSRKYMPLKK
jgi:hypothetical protein